MKQVLKEYYTPPQTTSVFIETGSSLCAVSTGEKYGEQTTDSDGWEEDD